MSTLHLKHVLFEYISDFLTYVYVIGISIVYILLNGQTPYQKFSYCKHTLSAIIWTGQIVNSPNYGRFMGPGFFNIFLIGYKL